MSERVEIWKPIPNHEGYEVSNNGNVRTLKNKGRLLTPTVLLPKGYLRVKLCDYGKERKWMVHRLVAMAFMPDFDESLQVNHINGIRNDNRLENLECCTSSENMQHSYDVLKRKPAMLGKKFSAETREKMSKALKGKKRTPEQIKRNSLAHVGKGLLSENPNAHKTVCVETGQVFNSAKEAALAFGISPNSIYQSCLKGGKANGFHFKYLNE